MHSSNNQYDEWIGKTETKSDVISTKHVASLAATLDSSHRNLKAGDSLPPLWHWLFFLELTRQSGLSIDGHPRKGVFLPPIELPRRMWAGSRIQFHQPLLLDEHASKISTIKSIQFKEGRSGKLAFVCVRHEISGSAGLAISEEQDIVYRDKSSPEAPAPTAVLAPAHYDFSLSVSPDPVLLFRYSALTFNSHRIHYDRDYATKVEGYPGLVVHGPLLATLLAGLVTEKFPDKDLRNFEFKAVSPVFDGDSFVVCGLNPDSDSKSKLWIGNSDGNLCVKAEAILQQV